MKKKIAWAVAFIAMCIAVFGNPVVKINNHRLKKAVTALDEGQTVTLNEVVPFEWDVVYTFSPYTSEEEIEKVIGFKSRDIVANNVNEGMTHLIFTKGEKVQAAVLGYPSKLGYRIDFFKKVNYERNIPFTVAEKNDFTELLQAEVIVD
ncbi:MAG: hypothetical protein IJN69_02710 [Oscillospiraceae bacterium]|nr:hypothetical protein [Oscillospiraceae bacterium]